MFNGAYAIEMTNTSTVVFMKARNSLVVRCRKKRVNRKKTKHGESIFFKALPNTFRLTS